MPEAKYSKIVDVGILVLGLLNDQRCVESKVTPVTNMLVHPLI